VAVPSIPNDSNSYGDTLGDRTEKCLLTNPRSNDSDGDLYPDDLEARIAELREREELDSLRAPIDGNEVMTYLGIEPGREVGAIMRMLLERRIEHGPYSPEEAYGLLDEWRNKQHLTPD
jgi:poly(A) polymerase